MCSHRVTATSAVVNGAAGKTNVWHCMLTRLFHNICKAAGWYVEHLWMRLCLFVFCPLFFFGKAHSSVKRSLLRSLDSEASRTETWFSSSLAQHEPEVSTDKTLTSEKWPSAKKDLKYSKYSLNCSFTSKTHERLEEKSELDMQSEPCQIDNETQRAICFTDWENLANEMSNITGHEASASVWTFFSTRFGEIWWICMNAPADVTVIFVQIGFL